MSYKLVNYMYGQNTYQPPAQPITQKIWISMIHILQKFKYKICKQRCSCSHRQAKKTIWFQFCFSIPPYIRSFKKLSNRNLKAYNATFEHHNFNAMLWCNNGNQQPLIIKFRRQLLVKNWYAIQLTLLTFINLNH